jgi:transcription elongation GreA/GreB family factor
LKALEFQLRQAREAYATAQKIEDVNERRRQAATPLRDVRYFAARVRTAQVITDPTSTDTVAFGSTVTFRRGDGRVQKYRIGGEDEADPKSGSISFVSLVARLLMGKAVGDVVGASDHPEAIIFLSYITAMLEKAGWVWIEWKAPEGQIATTYSFPGKPSIGQIGFFGVTLQINPAHDRALSAPADALGLALIAEGVEATLDVIDSPSIPIRETVHIIVGKKRQ